MARVGQLARLLREQAGVDERLPTDLDRIAKWCSVVVADIPLDGFLGYYTSVGNRHGILLKEGQPRTQRRFTLAHELGHLSLPGHDGATPCADRDVLRPRVSRERERAANEFAAELLMPAFRFRSDIRDRDPSIELLAELADEQRYDVSLTAAGIRLAKLTHEPVAVVCSEAGRLKWKDWSRNFSYALPSSGGRVPGGSVAAAVLRGEDDSRVPERIDNHAWFDGREQALEVYESAINMHRLGRVLSVIWVVERD